MKAENFANLILTKCVTKKGTLRKSYEEMLYHIIHYQHSRRRTFHWQMYGRSFRDTHIRDIELLTILGIDYGYFNDSPKGGQNGNFIILTQKGYNRIKPFLKEYHNYVNNKRFDDILPISRIIAKKVL